MNPLSFQNFLYVPANGNEGEIFELEDSKTYDKNSVILIPYQNPQQADLNPRFFRILKRHKYAPGHSAEKPAHIRLKTRTSREEYLKKIIALKEHIQRG